MLAAAALPRRTEIAIALALGVLTVAAWLLTIRLMGPAMSGGMVGDQISPGLMAAVDVGMWVIMMAAMMLPSTVPVLAAVTQIARSRKQQAVSSRAPWVFGLGYLLVWIAVGVIAATIDLGGRAILGTSPALNAVAPVAAGVILALAGLYQLSPLKNRCLRHCRSPFGFLMTNWREGTTGAVRLGVRHGVYCLGCCWALMGTLLVTEALGIVWPITLSLLIFVEKVLPGGRYVALVATVGLVALGIAQATGLVMLVSPGMT